MKNWIFLAISVAVIFLNVKTKAAEGIDSARINRGRLTSVIVGTGMAYGASLISLNHAWYKKERTSFHFYNDNSEWNQVDKAGHAYSAYQLSSIGNRLFRWANLPEKKSAIWGAVMSQAFMITIDVFDGFSQEYGFSWGDIAADLAGAGFFLSQELMFKEQKIKMKYSFHPSSYASLRPDILGEGFLDEMLKDYNGQTYWLSFDVYSIANKNPAAPKWLNLAFGYGADGMVYERENENLAYGYISYRQYYLGIDIDLSYIKSESKIVNSMLFFLDMVKLPAPAIEWSKKGTHYHWLYF